MSHGSGTIVAALCSECRYEASDLFIGMVTFGDRPAINRLVAYDAGRMVIVEREIAENGERAQVPVASEVSAIPDPMSQTLWPCPRCGVLSLKFSERGVWRSD